MTEAELCAVLEAILFASDEPLGLEQLRELLDEHQRPEREQLGQALQQLGASCQGRAFELVEVASGFRLQIRACFAPWTARLQEERAPRYSRALLETLALIAWRGPITRGEIEDIRGVTVSSSMIKTLQEREWIRVAGQRDVPGKPELLAVSNRFLDHFNLKSLAELPRLDDLTLEAGHAEESSLTVEPPSDKVQEEGEGNGELSFKSLLAELDSMEQNLKTDFEDLPRANPLEK